MQLNNDEFYLIVMTIILIYDLKNKTSNDAKEKYNIV